MDTQLRIILFWALGLVIMASLIEAVVLTWRNRRAPNLTPSHAHHAHAHTHAHNAPYDWRALGVSLADQAGRVLMNFVPITLAAPAFELAAKHRLFHIELNAVWAIALLFLGQEFFYYWYHRLAHRVRWFWANHAVHHSPNQLNLSAAYRLGWFGRIAGAAVFFTPLVWLGFETKVVVAVFAINLLYQFWIHATWIPKLGFLEGIFNTPSAHRVHHASNLVYLDANYGGVLVIFDRLFGTYIPERGDVPCVYGWVKPITSHNPLAIELTQWAALFKDILRARSLGEALRYAIRPPGWRPADAAEASSTTEDMRARALTTSA